MSKIKDFINWLNQDEDPLIGKVEMKPQKEREITDEELLERHDELDAVYEKVYDTKHNKQIIFFENAYRVVGIVLAILFAIILIRAVSWMPQTGIEDKPVNNEVSERYIENGLEETGSVNIVTGMILDYRAFDTFGETTVLFVAATAVLILLRLDGGDEKEEKKQAMAEENDRIYEPKNDAILQRIAFILVPIIFIFGIYVILNGHLSPGGGFSGGAIIGAGMILYLNAFGFKKTERFFTQNTYKYVCLVALTFYCLAKSYSFFTGGNGLESVIPLGTPGSILSGGLILPLNICVGAVVACTMYTFYVMFRKGGF